MGASAALALLDDDTTSPASRRLASAPAAPGTRPLLILGQAPRASGSKAPASHKEDNLMVRQILDAAKKGMEKCVDDMKQNLATIRTGRASISILDHIQANYYGTPTPLNQMASLSTPDPTLIVIQPWDPSTISAIEKAILTSDLGLNPTNDGKVIRLPVPPLTQERRKQLAKSVGHIAEQHRVAVRQVRHDANDQLKALLKDKKISEDEEKDGLKKVQDMTNSYIEKVEELQKRKEAEILEI
jgi:ribosome recycling factor